MKNYLQKRLRFLVLSVVVTCFTIPAIATEYTVKSIDEFNDLVLVAGDVVTWTDGTYLDEGKIVFTADGTSSSPIILKAETPGGVIFTNEVKMEISGDYVVVDGFYWNGGAGTNNHIVFRKGEVYANNSMLINCAFNNLTPDGTEKHRWVVLYGTNNVVQGCSFLNKNSPGALILVELEYNDYGSPVGHQIRNNYFYNYVKRDPEETHSGDSETIRVGTSEYQDKDASVTVEGNYFYKADGENEIITNKSANNSYLNNTFRSCRGSLVMRHGASATVTGNYFLGENVEGTGGIRVTDSYHVITNNYFQDLISTGDKWNNGITLVGGSDASGGTGNGYQKVDDVVIAFNTLYNVESPIFYNDRSSYDPTGVLAHNVVYTTLSDVVGGDISGTGQGMTYEGNIFGGSTIGVIDDGITEADALFAASGEIFKPSSTGPAANVAGSDYASTVNDDIEGFVRPNTDMDAGAHEVSGATGTALYEPYTNEMVGVSVGACFLDATGGSLDECINVSDYLTVSSVPDFISEGSTQVSNVSSNVSWTAVKDQDKDWFTITPTSGTGNGTISITVEENSLTDARIGTVTVTGDGLSARTINVSQNGYVAPVGATGVSFTSSTTTVGLGGTLQLSSTVAPADATNVVVSYSSGDISVATVDAVTGILTGLSEGIATITVTTDDGGFKDTIVITVVAPSIGDNLALNKAIEGTGTADGDNVAANLVDGLTATRWAVSGFPQTATIDLGAVFTLGSTELVCYKDRAYQFTVSTSSTEDGTYIDIVDRSANATGGSETLPIIDKFASINGRYVKLTITGADTESYDGSWMSLLEFRVFEGDPLGIDDFNTEEVVLTPNPASNYINIVGAKDYKTLTVYDQVGKLIINQPIKGESIDISSLKSGIYIFRLTGDDRIVNRRVIKK